MAARMKVTDEQVVAAYQQYGSVWKAADALDICGQAVHERLQKLGVNTRNPNLWTNEQINLLKEKYHEYADSGRLGELANILGKHKTNVCRKARQFGLSDIRRKKPYFAESTSAFFKEWHKNNEHPRGFANRKHTPETREKLKHTSKINAEISKIRDFGRQESRVMKIMKSKWANGQMVTYVRPNVTWKQGWREFGGKRVFYRSKWEANFGRYLQFLKEHGEIIDWEHEADVFWFEGIKRGCVSYLPDFKVINKNGEIVYYEVKGWMDAKSKTKIKRMAKYHPDVKLIVIQAAEYREIKKKVAALIEGWE